MIVRLKLKSSSDNVENMYSLAFIVSSKHLKDFQRMHIQIAKHITLD